MAAASVRGAPARGRPERPLWTAILRLLEERASHGYELVARLGERGPRSHSQSADSPSAQAPSAQATSAQATSAQATSADAVSVYRALRAMEAEGIVSSTWDVSQRGPARRVYVPTPAAGRAVGN